MRPQARPEIKSRKRSTEPAMATSFDSRDGFVDLAPSDDLPERDIYADLGDGAPPSEARREAEKLFGRFVADQKPVPTQVASEAPVPTAPELVAPVRVLPDLLAVAREEERRAGEAPKPKRAAKGAGTTKPRKKSEQARTQVGLQVIDPPAQHCGMLNGHAEAALALSRRSGTKAKLPLGQRWKERRLPRVCWDRRGGSPALTCSLDAARAMILDPLHAQTTQARSPGRPLPGQEFVETDAVAGARFIDAYQAAVHRRQHLRLPARNPTLEPRRRESIGGQDFAI
jgi:hypothetical protein